MMKLYWLGIVSLSGFVWFGLDHYMTAKKLRWEAVAEVWPFWLLMITAGFLLGGLIWGIIAHAAITSNNNARKAEYEQYKTTYRQTVENDLKDKQDELNRQTQTLDKRVKLAEQALDEKEQAGMDKLEKKKRKLKAQKEALTQALAEVKQLKIDTQTENEGYRLRALNASKALEREREKYKAALAKQAHDNTEQDDS